MKTHLWEKKKYYFGSTPVFHPNKIQIFSPYLSYPLLLLQRRCFVKSQAEAQSSSPGSSSPCQCQHPQPTFASAEGRSQRQNGAQRDKEHLEKKNSWGMGCIEYPSLAAHHRVHQNWGTVNPDPNLIQTIGSPPCTARIGTCTPVSRRGDQASPPKSPSPPPRQRVFRGPPPTPRGKRAGSESENAAGLGTLRPPHCCQQGWGQPAELSTPGCRQILPVRWPAVGTANI